MFFEGPKGAKRRAQGGQEGPKRGLSGPDTDRPETNERKGRAKVSKCRRPKRAPERPERAEEGPRGPKTRPRGPKKAQEGRRGGEEGPKRGLGGPDVGRPEVKEAKVSKNLRFL